MSNNTKSENKNTASSVSVSSSSGGSDIMDWLGKHGFFAVSALTAVGLYIGSFVESSKYISGSDDWNTIRNRVFTIIGLSIGGAMALGLAALLYFLANQEKAVYFQIIMSSLAVGMSYAALGVAAISRT
jgi:hypothetical protein